MKLSALKKIRVIISLIFFLSAGIIFLDYRSFVPAAFIKAAFFLQFVPSALKYSAIASLSAAGFLAALMLALFFGRAYCSTICPLGTIQDFIIYASRRFKIKKFFRYTKELKILRYSVLVIALLFIPIGGLFLINLLDPFSNFGRIFSDLFKPGVIWGNNVLSSLLENFNNYSLYPIEQKPAVAAALVLPAAMLLLIGWLSLKKGRLYCNSVCPVGTLLGFLSKYSLFKIVIDEKNCNGCGKCELACKGSCINKKEKFVDFSRCVGCMNCFSSCPSEGLKFEFRYKPAQKPETIKTDFAKRDFIKQSSLLVLGLAGAASAQYKIESKKDSKTVLFRKNPVTPPGSKGIEHFTSHCTACHLCVSACPTKVLQPSFLEYGFTGMLQPRLDNSKGFCNFECNVCGSVCQNGAILPVPVEEKKKIQVGVAVFVHENCIVYTENTDCGACSEHCPTKAVNMIPYNNLFIPKVTEEYCVGCGACEHACPVKPYKAIYVEGNHVHKTAKKNVPHKAEPAVKKEDETSPSKGKEKKSVPQEDFPF
jgi:ferredoxin